jgi:hypothetical protein
MKNPQNQVLPAELTLGLEQFEKWRSEHKTRARFPEHLWSLAAKLALEYGLNKTAHALRLDYNCLKKRINSAVSGNMPHTEVKPQFLQLLPSELNSELECTIECEDAKGSRISIHLKGRELPDLTAIISSLWSCNQ